MAAVNRKVKHGQEWDVARANFERGIRQAEEQYGKHFKPVEWSEDRTAARIHGTGFDLHLKLDPEFVNVNGHVPFFLRFLEGPVMKFIEESFHKPGAAT
jgi:hypothetical protein